MHLQPLLSDIVLLTVVAGILIAAGGFSGVTVVATAAVALLYFVVRLALPLNLRHHHRPTDQR